MVRISGDTKDFSRIGEMLKEMPKRDGGQAMKVKARLHDVTEVQPTLADIGIAKHESHRYQKIADLPEQKLVFPPKKFGSYTKSNTPRPGLILLV